MIHIHSVVIHARDTLFTKRIFKTNDLRKEIAQSLEQRRIEDMARQALTEERKEQAARESWWVCG